jgi:hypothetical protein
MNPPMDSIKDRNNNILTYPDIIANEIHSTINFTITINSKPTPSFATNNQNVTSNAHVSLPSFLAMDPRKRTHFCLNFGIHNHEMNHCRDIGIAKLVVFLHNVPMMMMVVIVERYKANSWMTY